MLQTDSADCFISLQRRDGWEPPHSSTESRQRAAAPTSSYIWWSNPASPDLYPRLDQCSTSPPAGCLPPWVLTRSKIGTCCSNSTNNNQKSSSVRAAFCPLVPVMVVIHSRRRVLISVRSQAPASVGVGRGMNLDEDSDVSEYEADVEGRISAWKVINCWSGRTLYTKHRISKLLLAHLYCAPWFLWLHGRWWEFCRAVRCLVPLHGGGAFFNRATYIFPLVASLQATDANPRLFELQQWILLLRYWNSRKTMPL